MRCARQTISRARWFVSRSISTLEPGRSQRQQHRRGGRKNALHVSHAAIRPTAPVNLEVHLCAFACAAFTDATHAHLLLLGLGDGDGDGDGAVSGSSRSHRFPMATIIRIAAFCTSHPSFVHTCLPHLGVTS